MRQTSVDSKVRRNLSKRWYNMMDRCYNDSHPRYPDYGGVGIHVDSRWMSKETFIEDAKKLPGYDENLLLSGKIHLDKDIVDPSNKRYSLDKCVFVSPEENNKVKPNQMKSFIAHSPDGSAFEVTNQSEFAREHGLIQTTISACIRGDRRQHKGWTFSTKE